MFFSKFFTLRKFFTFFTRPGHWLASADTYGADRKWVLLKQIPIELSDDEEMEEAGQGGPSGV